MWLTDPQLASLGFAKLGKNVLLDSQAIIFNPRTISIGDNCRVDAFSVLSAGEASFHVGKNVHISHAARVYGSAGIEIHDYAGISSGVSIFTVSDDYSSSVLNNPTVPLNLRNIKSAGVVIGKASIIGANTVVLPGVTIGSGASIGALSLVNKNIPDGWIVSGNPLRKIGNRDVKQINFLIAEFESKLEEQL